MKLAEAAKLISIGALWRTTHTARAGRALIAGLGSTDADNRLIAGMLLLRGGAPAVPLLREVLEHGSASAPLLRVAGDSGARELASGVARYADDPDPHVARAARLALDALHGAVHG